MVDIKNFITSLKCSWIKILTKSSKTWMDIFTLNEHDYLQKIIDFGGTVLLDAYIKKNNAFWKDVLYSSSC